MKSQLKVDDLRQIFIQLFFNHFSNRGRRSQSSNFEPKSNSVRERNLSPAISEEFLPSRHANQPTDSCRCRRRRRKVVHSCSQWSFVVGDCDRMQCCCLTQTGQVSVLYGVVGGQKCICWYGWTSVV